MGKRNGKGKEYNYEQGDENNSITTYYEGNFVEGEKNGNFKKYFELNGNFVLVFECEFLNDKENGKGKEYSKRGKLIFEGEYLNGNKWNGNGYDNKNNIAYTLKKWKWINQRI